MEDDKKKYEDALERCKKEFNFSNLAYSHEEIKQRLEHVFPELKESEDEKARKAILDCIKYMKTNYCLPSRYTSEQYGTWISWLEKQGEQKPIFRVGDYIRNTTTGDKVLIEQLDLATKAYCYVSYDGAAVNHSDFPFVKQDEWELVEQKPADKVEPKFKVGDWCIDNEDGTIFQIMKVLNNTYTYKTNEGYEYSCTHYLLENDAKLWTIQDAKEGDVIFSNDDHGSDSIELIKGIYDKCINFWFCLSSKNNFKDYHYEVYNGNIPYTNFASRKDATPATKEQRDLLFAKMKEADYEWDSEKKELKKIEQKNIEGTFINVDEVRENFVNEVYRVLANDTTNDRANDIIYYFDSLPTIYLHTNKPLPSDGDDFDMDDILKNPAGSEEDVELTDFESALFSAFSDAWQEYLIGKEVNVEKWAREHSAELLEVAREQNTAWSEEDERMFNSIVGNLNNGEWFDIYQADWLKSLKERIQPKHKQEEIVLHWESGHPESHKSVLILRHGNVVVEGEWNEETGRWYQYGFQCYLEDNEVIGWMNKKSLLSSNSNSYSHWNPSDEQMEVLHKYAEQNNYDGSALTSLYRDLKKLKGE